MMRITILASTLALAACGGAQSEAPPPHAKAADNCPMSHPGVDVAVSDVEGGIALTLTAGADRVDELRAMARRMASMHEGHMDAGGGMHGHGAHEMEGHEHGMGGGEMMMPPATATVTDVDGGVRVVLTAKDPANVDKLRTHVRHHAQRMRAGECPMMDKAAAPTPAPDGDHATHHPGS